MSRRLHSRSRRRAGFTVLEVTISAAVLVIGVLGMVGSIAASLKLVGTNKETVIAHQAARGLVERMQNVTFAQVFATYNGNAADDPSGANTAPGSRFDIEGLAPQPVAAGQTARAGTISFPTIAGTNTLSESVVDAELGMPRDLNGDGVITAGAMPGSYLILPVRIQVRWRSAGGDRSMSFVALLMNR